jgi:hypothetical protein
LVGRPALEGRGVGKSGEIVTPWLDADGGRWLEKKQAPYIQDASGLQKMKCTYDGI